MSSLLRKVVLITGASSGIGAGTAVHLASLGSRVALNGRNMENLQKVAKKCEDVGLCKEKILIAQGDLTKEEDVNDIVEKTVTKFGQLDVLVNNAGVILFKLFQDSSMEDLDRVIDSNVRSVIRMTQKATPFLIKSKGNIVNVSSFLGQRPISSMVYYCMTKAATDMLTSCLAQELGGKGVRVNSVNPGAIKSSLQEHAGIPSEQAQQLYDMQKWLHPIGRYGEPDEVAKAIAFLASDEASFINGSLLMVDGGRSHLTPSIATGPIM